MESVFFTENAAICYGNSNRRNHTFLDTVIISKTVWILLAIPKLWEKCCELEQVTFLGRSETWSDKNRLNKPGRALTSKTSEKYSQNGFFRVNS